jgi:hypothetical protein
LEVAAAFDRVRRDDHQCCQGEGTESSECDLWQAAYQALGTYVKIPLWMSCLKHL